MLSRVASWHQGSAVFADLDADAPAQIVEALLGDLGKLARSSACMLPFIWFACLSRCSRSRSILRLTLPAGVFGNSVTNSIERGYSCWLSRWRTKSWISVAKASSPGAVGDDEGLDDLAAQLVGHADRAGLAHVGVLQHRVLDLDGAHGPAGGDDHVVGAAGMIEIAVLVDPAEVLGGKPGVAPPDLDLAGHAGRAGFRPRPAPRRCTPGIGLPSEPGLTTKSSAPG